jgi:hypothetical protein
MQTAILKLFCFFSEYILKVFYLDKKILEVTSAKMKQSQETSKALRFNQKDIVISSQFEQFNLLVTNAV